MHAARNAKCHKAQDTGHFQGRLCAACQTFRRLTNCTPNSSNTSDSSSTYHIIIINNNTQ